jgi:hypothetical protein
MSAVTEVVILTLQPGAQIDDHMKAFFRILEKQKGFQGGHWGRWEELEDRIQLFVRKFRFSFPSTLQPRFLLAEPLAS